MNSKKDDFIEFNQDTHISYLEDAQEVGLPVDDITLNDEELEKGGLVKTSAYVRTKKSKNALRVAKHKEMKKEKGIKQLNVEVPEELKEEFKKAAKEACETGEFKKPEYKKPESNKSRFQENASKSVSTLQECLFCKTGFLTKLKVKIALSLLISSTKSEE